jgi:hypothetical protein
MRDAATTTAMQLGKSERTLDYPQGRCLKVQDVLNSRVQACACELQE